MSISQCIQVHVACAYIQQAKQCPPRVVWPQAHEAELNERYNEVQALYDLIAEFEIPVPDMDMASYHTLRPDFTALRHAVDEIESAKEDQVASYAMELAQGKPCACVRHTDEQPGVVVDAAQSQSCVHIPVSLTLAVSGARLTSVVRPSKHDRLCCSEALSRDSHLPPRMQYCSCIQKAYCSRLITVGRHRHDSHAVDASSAKAWTGT